MLFVFCFLHNRVSSTRARALSCSLPFSPCCHSNPSINMCWVNEWMISWAPVSLHTICFSVLLSSKNSWKCTFSHCIFHSLHYSPLCLSGHPKYPNIAYRLFIICCYIILWNHLPSIFHLHPILNWLPGLSMLDFFKKPFHLSLLYTETCIKHTHRAVSLVLSLKNSLKAPHACLQSPPHKATTA